MPQDPNDSNQPTDQPVPWDNEEPTVPSFEEAIAPSEPQSEFDDVGQSPAETMGYFTPETPPVPQPTVPAPPAPIADSWAQPTETAVQPTPATNGDVSELAASATSVAAVPLLSAPRKSKKGLIIGLIIGAALLVFGGASVLAYNVWYQNPQKVITDAIINAATAKTAIYTGVVTSDSDDYKIKIDVTARQASAVGSLAAKATLTVGTKEYKLDGSALIDKAGDLYFKVENLDSIATEYKNLLQGSDPAVLARVDTLVKKIDGTWIKISSDDLKSFSDSYATAKTCINDTVTKFKDDKAAIKEVSTLYKKHQFIAVDESLGTKDGSLGYMIKADKTQTKAFAEGLKDTTIYKSLNKCDSSYTIDTSDFDSTLATDSSNTTKVEVWVSRWSHQMTKLSLSDTTDGTKLAATIAPVYGQPVTVETPASSTTLAKLQSDIEALMQPSMTE